jgi:ABC-type polysaccharide/polyol phosphate transport system ATPase subunit
MTAPALRFEHVTKRYRRATYRSLRSELTRQGATGEDVAPPALDDVSFDVEPGDAFAVIGPNGAGKSTALRLAARITAPTSGTIEVVGRVGALIEVGAGIHPELTGRENIWLYGAILGLTRREIAERFDEIVEFAELGPVVDRMVKHYSSGMQLRLGFAVAAGVQPDLLVVDEALAVGDARFQVRCIERMQELVRSGTTLVYVSHDLASVSAVCTRAALLVDGRVRSLGPATDTIDAYVDWVHSHEVGGDEAAVTALDGSPAGALAPGDGVVVTIPLPAERSGPTTVALGIRDGHPWNLLGSAVTVPASHADATVRCRIQSLPLGTGTYELWASIDGDGADGAWHKVGAVRIDAGDGPRPIWQPPVQFAHTWDL